MIEFSHDNNLFDLYIATSAKLVSLLRVLVRYYIGDEDGGWHDWPHRPGNEVKESNSSS